MFFLDTKIPHKTRTSLVCILKCIFVIGEESKIVAGNDVISAIYLIQIVNFGDFVTKFVFVLQSSQLIVGTIRIVVS